MDDAWAGDDLALAKVGQSVRTSGRVRAVVDDVDVEDVVVGRAQILTTQRPAMPLPPVTTTRTQSTSVIGDAAAGRRIDTEIRMTAP